jgi:hypothetical protein
MAVAGVVNINEVLDRHVSMQIECVDRLYLNDYVPNLQVGGRPVRFMTGHLGRPIPSPAICAFRGIRTLDPAESEHPVWMIPNASGW